MVSWADTEAARAVRTNAARANIFELCFSWALKVRDGMGKGRRTVGGRGGSEKEGLTRAAWEATDRCEKKKTLGCHADIRACSYFG